MKKLLPLLSLILLLTACGSKSTSGGSDVSENVSSGDSSGTSNTPIGGNSEVNSTNEVPIVKHDNPRVDYTHEEVAEIINKFDNLKVSEEFFYTSVPKTIDHLSEFISGYSHQLPPEETYEEFKRVFAYLFPEHELDMECLFYYSYTDDMGDNHDAANHDLSDENNFEAFINCEYEKSPYMHFMFYDERNKLKENSVSMYYRSPFGNDYCVFNQGVCNKLVAEQRGEDKYYAYEQFRLSDSDFGFEYVGAYPPDSDATFKMLDDKEISIKDAVSVFENYIASIPCKEEPIFGIHAYVAYAYRLDDEHYGFEFYNSRIYDGIPFSYVWDGAHIDALNRDMSYGIMVKSNDVDHIYAPFNSYKAYDEVKHTEFVPFEDAVKTVSKEMTQYVDFEVTRAELLFRMKQNIGASDQIGEIRRPVYPCWKLTLDNQNDDMVYVAYVNALTGEFQAGT